MEASEIWEWAKIERLRATVRVWLYGASGYARASEEEIFRRVFERLVEKAEGMEIERLWQTNDGAWVADISMNIPTRSNPREVIGERLSKLVEEAREKTREAVSLRILLDLAFSQGSEAKTEAREVMEKAGIKVY